MLQFLLNYNYIVLMEHIEYQIIMQLAINNKSIQYVSASSHIQNDLGHNSLHIDFILFIVTYQINFINLLGFIKLILYYFYFFN